MIYHEAIFYRYADPMALLLKKTGHKCTRKPSCFCGKYSPQRCEQIMDSSILRKRQGTEPYCIIHCTDNDSTSISPNYLDSWETLQKAGEIRDHEAFLVYRLPMTKSRMEYCTIANVEGHLQTNIT